VPSTFVKSFTDQIDRRYLTPGTVTSHAYIRGETSWFPERHTRAFVCTGVNATRARAIRASAPFRAARRRRSKSLVLDISSRTSERLPRAPNPMVREYLRAEVSDPGKSIERRGRAATSRIPIPSSFNRFLQKN